MILMRSRVSTAIKKATLLAIALSQNTNIGLKTSMSVTDGDKEVVKILYIYYQVQF